MKAVLILERPASKSTDVNFYKNENFQTCFYVNSCRSISYRGSRFGAELRPRRFPGCASKSLFVNSAFSLSGPLNRLNAVLSLLRPLNCYRPRSAMGSAIGRAYLALSQEPIKGGFSKGGFCRVQCHAEGNKKYPSKLGPPVHLALEDSQPREAHIEQKPPSKTLLFLVPDCLASPHR